MFDIIVLFDYRSYVMVCESDDVHKNYILPMRGAYASTHM